jgi:hypothetical protein
VVANNSQSAGDENTLQPFRAQWYYVAMNRFVRVVVLALAMPLLLPHGWCCIVANEIARLTASPKSCCKCEHASPAKPIEKPSHLPPSKCPCFDRHTVMADSVSVDNPILHMALDVVPIPSSHVFIGIDQDSICVVHPPTYDLNIFKCVWRC